MPHVSHEVGFFVLTCFSRYSYGVALFRRLDCMFCLHLTEIKWVQYRNPCGHVHDAMILSRTLGVAMRVAFVKLSLKYTPSKLSGIDGSI